MVTNDVEKLSPGSGCYAAHLSPQGKIVAHMRIFKDDDALWLSLERDAIPKLIAAFDRLLIMEDVQVADVSADYTIIGLFGPQGPSVLSSWLGEPANVHALHSHRIVADGRVIASQLGYEIWVPRDKSDAVLKFFTGQAVPIVERDTWEVLRTEAGIPVFGVDIDETTTMPELGEAGISYDKGCYIGQEVVAKVKYIGHVNRRFIGLVLGGNELPAVRSPILKGGREVGYITTAVISPRLNRPIALGFVSRAAYAAGSEVETGAGTAKIVDLPFHL
jgi:folate-binding protein YgfZ